VIGRIKDNLQALDQGAGDEVPPVGSHGDEE
jgi:hypothetical protein